MREYVRKIHSKLAEKEFHNGRYYFRRGKNRAALIYFDKIIDKHPDNPYWVRANYYKALILDARGEHDEAARYLARVVAWPGDVDVKADAKERLETLRR